MRFFKGSVIEDGDAVQAVAARYIDQVPEPLRDARVSRDGERFHVTILFSPTTVPVFPEGPVEVFPLGLCKKGDIWYVPVLIPGAERLNPTGDFHITLGFGGRDRHDIPKDATGLLELHPGALDVLGRLTTPFSAKTAGICTHLFALGHSSARMLLRLALWHGRRGEVDRCLKHVPALAEVDPLAAYYVRMSVDTYLRKDLVPVVFEMSAAAAGGVGLLAATALSDKQLKALWHFVDGCHEVHFMREGAVYLPHKLPMNFSGVFKQPGDPCHGVFASGAPSARYAPVLADLGITEIVTLTEDRNELTTHHLSTPDREPPTLDGTIAAIAVMEAAVAAGRRVLVHCLGGVGRTNTLLACYALHVSARRTAGGASDGGGTEPDAASMPPPLCGAAEAIEHIDGLRPKMILSQSQICFVHVFAEFLLTGARPPPKIPHSPLLPRLVLMCGLPCSGKSTLSQTLVDRMEGVARLNGDELGRKALVAALGASMGGAAGARGGSTVIVDRCHLSAVDRADMWALAFKPAPTLVLWVDTPAEECKARAGRRIGHKLSAGDAAGVVASLAGKMEPPGGAAEPWATVVRIQDSAGAERFLAGLGVATPPPATAVAAPPRTEEPFIRKFCRTRHLHNLGSATRDDLIFSPSDAQAIFCRTDVFIEEKVDGANLGFSVSEGRLRAQNRSHYVDSTSHTQFRDLGKWMQRHSDALLTVLQGDDEAAIAAGRGAYILYGEWLYAKHSVPYSRLPDVFIAFDLFDVRTERFVSRPVLEERLAGTGITLVPLVARTRLARPADAADFIGPSAFYDGPAEGVYVRVCDAQWTLERGKVVRPDFLSGDEHWSKHKVTPNGVQRPEHY